MTVEIITDITDEPITLAGVKGMLRITGNGHDGEMITMITAARKYMERALNKSLGTKTIKVTSDEELEEWQLPYGPVQEVTDEDTDDDNYLYTYTAGYTEVPEDVKQGLYMIIKSWNDVDDMGSNLPKQINNIIMANSNSPML